MSSRLVLDTNLLISAVLLADSLPRQVFDLALDEHTILISEPFLLELADVFSRPKFDKYVTETERMRFLVGFLKAAHMVEVSVTISACRDPKDNKLLELSLSGSADYLITGDADLLVLNPFEGIEILTPRDFLDR